MIIIARCFECYAIDNVSFLCSMIAPYAQVIASFYAQ